MGSIRNTRPSGLRSRKWIVYLKKNAPKGALVLAAIVALFGNGFLKWSSTECESRDIISVYKKNGELFLSRGLGFKNTGWQSGYLENLHSAIADIHDNAITVLKIDSCIMNNGAKEDFNEIELKSGQITKGKFFFKQQSGTAVNLKANVIYKIETTITKEATIGLFNRKNDVIIVRYFTLSEIQKNNIDSEKIETPITLYSIPSTQ